MNVQIACRNTPASSGWLRDTPAIDYRELCRGHRSYSRNRKVKWGTRTIQGYRSKLQLFLSSVFSKKDLFNRSGICRSHDQARL